MAKGRVVSTAVYELVPWLRAQVQARLDLARIAGDGDDGHWRRRTIDLGDGGTPEPVGHLYGGGQGQDWDGEPVDGTFVVVYDEGSPGGWQFDHLAANDPRDTIARCESELAILDEHVPYDCTWPGGSRCTVCASSGTYPNGVAIMAAFPCRTIRLIGHGYRYRPGYLEAWKPTG
jgi:hypothetical protein